MSGVKFYYELNKVANDIEYIIDKYAVFHNEYGEDFYIENTGEISNMIIEYLIDNNIVSP